jgi:hypothetical protein
MFYQPIFRVRLLGALVLLAAIRTVYGAAIPISETANCLAANSCQVMEFNRGTIAVTLRNISNANITVTSVTIPNPAFLFIFGDRNDRVISTSLVALQNFCNGAVLAPNASCSFTQIYDTDDPVLDNIIDKGHWELQNLVTLGDGTTYIATLGVDVLDPTPEPGTLTLLGSSLLGLGWLALRRNRA